MPIVVSTRGLPPARRRAAWLTTVCDTLGPLDVSLDDGPVAGEIRAGQVGALRVATLTTATPQTVRRTARLINQEDDDVYRAVVAISGGQILTQDSRTNRIARGAIALYDFTRPYEIRYPAGAPLKLVALTFPREALPVSPGVVASITATGLTGGTSPLLAPVVRRIVADLETCPPAIGHRLSRVALDLLAAAVMEQLGADADISPPSRRRAVLMQAQDHIEQNLSDVELSPARIAAALFVSTRYLHAIFAEAETTVSAWIRDRRLYRCCVDLADPALRHVPVSAIGARYGLPDSAHFSRVFREAVGVPPSEYRRATVVH